MRHLAGLIGAILCLSGCTSRKTEPSATPQPLYAPPLTVALDTGNGYAIDPITGDSIPPSVSASRPRFVAPVARAIRPLTRALPQLPEQSVALSRFSNSFPVKGRPHNDAMGPSDTGTGFAVRSTLLPNTGSEVPVIQPKPQRAQPLRFRDNASLDIQYLDVGQGLGFSYINSICRDRQGNLWIATDGYGLVKYDGTYLTTYTRRNGLSDDKVFSVVEGPGGQICISTPVGFTVFDGLSFRHFTVKDGLSSPQTYTLRQDKKGRVWLAFGDGPFMLFDGDRLVRFQAENKTFNDHARFMLEDRKGGCWFSTKDGVFLLKGDRCIPFFPGSRSMIGVYRIVEDPVGDIWFGSMSQGLSRYDGKVLYTYTTDNGLPSNSIRTLLADSRGALWIGSMDKGVIRMADGLFTRFTDAQGLSENKIQDLLEEPGGAIWAATLGGGISRIELAGFSRPLGPEAIGTARIRPMLCSSEGTFWMGSEDNYLISWGPSELKKLRIGSAPFQSGFRSLETGSSGALWLGMTSSEGLFEYTRGRCRYYPVFYDHGEALALRTNRKGELWVGTSFAGLFCLKKDSVYAYAPDLQGMPRTILAIREDARGNTWFGTKGDGLFKLTDSGFVRYGNRQGLFGRQVSAIAEDRDGALWLGTLGAGVCRFDGRQFTYFTEAQGLANNEVWSLQPEEDGRLWVGTDKGLSLLLPGTDRNDPSAYKVVSFGLADGLKSVDFNLNGVCIDSAHRIWWGTGKALICRDGSRPYLPDTPQAPRLAFLEINGRFLDFDKKNRAVRHGGIGPGTNYPLNLSLPYDLNHLTFHFSAINWRAPHKVKYSYRLVGSDAGWSTPSSEPRAEYRNLGHGWYRFEVRAIGSSQVWSPAFSYTFTIRPAWWQTWWFKTGAGLLLVLASLWVSRAIYRAKLRRQRLEMEKQLAVQLERQRISSEMHDDIGAGLSGIRLLTELTKSKVKEGLAEEDVEKIYKSVGEVSSKMKEVIWSLNTENDRLPRLVSYIQQQARAWLEHYPCRLYTEAPEQLPEVQVNGVVRRHILLLAREAVHNIIKHSGADTVQLLFRYEKGILTLEIADNGRGMKDTGDAAAGNGLKNMRRRMTELKGKMYMAHQEGLHLVFEIPIKN